MENIKSQAMEYLDELRESQPDLFTEPLQRSVLTDHDIQTIERKLGYQLPRSYVDFLQSYQLPPRLTVSDCFCGGYADCCEPDEEGDPFAALIVDWKIPSHSSVEQFLADVREEDMPLGGTEDSFLDAGFLKIVEFEGYFVFLDLVTGEIVRIYHEEVYDMSIVDGVDVTDYQQVRDYLTDRTICQNFYDFLQVLCTKVTYDECSMKFKTVENG